MKSPAPRPVALGFEARTLDPEGFERRELLDKALALIVGIGEVLDSATERSRIL